MDKYEHNCPQCKRTTYSINDYFCLKNKGLCEWCLGFAQNVYKGKRKVYEKSTGRKFVIIDHFAKYRPRNLSTE